MQFSFAAVLGFISEAWREAREFISFLGTETGRITRDEMQAELARLAGEEPDWERYRRLFDADEERGIPGPINTLEALWRE